MHNALALLRVRTLACKLVCSGLHAEDDGWLVVFVYDKATDKSSLCVYDAHTMSNTPVAKVKLPCRVPYGGCWLTV